MQKAEQVTYLTALAVRFHIQNKDLAQMFKVKGTVVSKFLEKAGLSDVIKEAHTTIPKGVSHGIEQDWFTFIEVAKHGGRTKSVMTEADIAFAEELSVAMLRYRREHGCSQRGLAALLGEAQSNIARCELKKATKVIAERVSGKLTACEGAGMPAPSTEAASRKTKSTEPMPFTAKLAEELQQKRAELGLTQKQMAEKIGGCNDVDISNAEHNSKKLSAAKANIIRGFLETSVSSEKDIADVVAACQPSPAKAQRAEKNKVTLSGPIDAIFGMLKKLYKSESVNIDVIVHAE